MLFLILQVLLPKTWLDNLPAHEQKWLSKALFQPGPKGQPLLRDSLQLWWYPPQPQLLYHQPPASPDLFFSRPFFLWMPYRMWKVRLSCVNPTCAGYQLNACGLYKTVRRVLDIDGYFYMGTEYLECGCCHKKVAAWSGTVLSQLSPGYRQQFPAILTYRYLISPYFLCTNSKQLRFSPAGEKLNSSATAALTISY